jgi:hypothetical protein
MFNAKGLKFMRSSSVREQLTVKITKLFRALHVLNHFEAKLRFLINREAEFYVAFIFYSSFCSHTSGYSFLYFACSASPSF